jgi:hypothetical protein
MKFWNPFKKKEQPKTIIPTNTEFKEIPYPDGDLNMQIGRLIFLGAVPFYVTALFPKDQSLTIKRLNPAQWKELQDNARKIAMEAAKKKEEIKPSGITKQSV